MFIIPKPKKAAADCINNRHFYLREDKNMFDEKMTDEQRERIEGYEAAGRKMMEQEGQRMTAIETAHLIDSLQKQCKIYEERIKEREDEKEQLKLVIKIMAKTFK
jgi:hypothetical protein